MLLEKKARKTRKARILVVGTGGLRSRFLNSSAVAGVGKNCRF